MEWTFEDGLDLTGWTVEDVMNLTAESARIFPVHVPRITIDDVEFEIDHYERINCSSESIGLRVVRGEGAAAFPVLYWMFIRWFDARGFAGLRVIVHDPSPAMQRQIRRFGLTYDDLPWGGESWRVWRYFAAPPTEPGYFRYNGRPSKRGQRSAV